MNNTHVSESYLSSHESSHKSFESETSHIKYFWVESLLGRVESQEWSTHFESLVCKLESMSSQMKLEIVVIF